MALVAAAMDNLVPKLLQLLQDEYKLQKGVKKQVESLARELKSMHAALCKVAEVPHDELDPQVKLWASEVREASYDMEDVLDTFLVRVDGGYQTAEDDRTRVNGLLEKMGKLFSLSKIKARREIANTIKDITKRVEEMTMRRERYRVDDRVVNSFAIGKSIDPRLLFLHTKASELVGIDEPRDALIKELLRVDDDGSDKNTKVVSIFGCGGLGKTTLAKVVYNKLAIDMDIQCKACVPVGQHPDLKKVFRDILLELHKEYYMNKTNFMILDGRQLIDEIHDSLKEKRYIIVMDDIWEVSTWNAIRTALKNNNLGSKIIITTRCNDVAQAKPVYYSYQLMPLLPESSKILFYGRIFGSKEKCPERFSELSQCFLKKCGGVPLAIITLSSLLADKLKDIADWERLCNAIGFGISSSEDGMRNMLEILSLSYYNLPSYLKTCFLYLSMYPEDYEIDKDQLVWMWVDEGFIQPQHYCDDLFELGETYFNQLINRSLIQPVGCMDSSMGVYGCRVHDMILDLIRSLSKEENFVTTSKTLTSSKTKQIIRRLSLNRTTTFPKVDMSRVRSLAMFHPSIDLLPSVSSFGILRVLVLEYCNLGGSEGIKLNVGNLIHLRCLWLRHTGLRELPEGIEKLQYLQVVNMVGCSNVPSINPIFWLKRLVCLDSIRCCPTPGNLLRNLTSLQVLWPLIVDENSVGSVDELGHLTKLTDLRIDINIHIGQSMYDALFNSLGKLQRLRLLDINHYDCWCGSKRNGSKRNSGLINWENWMPPPYLRVLNFYSNYSFQSLPKWIHPESLPHLAVLSLAHVDIVRPEDLQILGELPSLSNLWLWASRGNVVGPLQRFVLSADAFPRATRCEFFNVVTVPSMFPQGAMPRVEKLHFCLRARDFFSSDGLDFSDLVMEHFPSLQKASFHILILESNLEGVEKLKEMMKFLEEAKQVKETLKHAANVHPNHPSIEFLSF